MSAYVSRTNTANVPDQTPIRLGRTRRGKLACLRCQRRKIRCDGLLPKCSSCHKARVDCLAGKKVSQDDTHISRSTAASLHDQVQRLSAALQSRCPDIDISEIVGDGQGPADAGCQATGASINSTSKRTNHAVIDNENRNREGPLSSPSLDTMSASLATPATGTSRMASSIISPDSRREQAVNLTPGEHEIGLVSMSGGDTDRYLGPSSGLPFARVLFKRARLQHHMTMSQAGSDSSPRLSSSSRSKPIFNIGPTTMPLTSEEAVELSRTYFENVHIQYPFLHEPTHMARINDLYKSPETVSYVTKFQVTMVMAISAVILSKRLKIPYSGEGLCATATQYVDFIDFQSSVAGVHCLLLLIMFALHSSFLGADPWYLNYQCLAAVLDLGLQRDVPVSSKFSPFDQEMRTRAFWVIYSLDRILATTLGRPIGLRDEACDLRLPSGLEDADLEPQSPLPLTPQYGPGPAACAMTLFRLSSLNSEIKYILHSLTRNTPDYTYPRIPDIGLWQAGLWERLEAIHNEFPQFSEQDRYLGILCEIRYHEMIMLLYRPSPRIRSPTKESLSRCQQSAKLTIQLYSELYDMDRMTYSWINIHSICLSTITFLFCTWTLPEVAIMPQLDLLLSTSRLSSSLLSAAGEHWSEAKRTRKCLDDLAAATTRWLLNTHATRLQQPPIPAHTPPSTTTPTPSHIDPDVTIALQPQASPSRDPIHDSPPYHFSGIDDYVNIEDLASILGAPETCSQDPMLTMEGMFREYQPMFDFNNTGSGGLYGLDGRGEEAGSGGGGNGFFM